MKQLLFCFLMLGGAAAVLSLLVTRLMLVLLPKWGMVDKPDFKRHIHTVVIPRGGGIGVILVFLAVILSFLFFGCHCMPVPEEVIGESFRFLIPLAILFPLGVLDDKFALSARTKFFFQIAAAVLAWYLGFRMRGIFGITFPTWLNFCTTILWIVGFINAFNMIDGVDGLASGIAIISACCMVITALMTGHTWFAVVPVPFIGAFLGFLFYNWNPARIFMGDTGSMFIGYTLSVMGLVVEAQRASVLSIVVPLLACGIPLLDIIFAVWRRMLGEKTEVSSDNGGLSDEEEMDSRQPDGTSGSRSFFRRVFALCQRLGTADQRHLHHRLLLRYGKNQRKTVLHIYGIAVILALVGIFSTLLRDSSLVLTLLILIGTFSYIVNRLAFVELWRTTEVAYQHFHSARIGLILSYIVCPVMDLITLGLSYYLASGTLLQVRNLLRSIVIVMGILICSRSYRVFWNLAVADDYFRLMRTMFLGFFVAWGVDWLLGVPHIERLHFFACCFATAIFIFCRFALHYFRNSQISLTARQGKPEEIGTRTLLLGISQGNRYYRNLLTSDLERAAREQLVGVISRDAHYVHSWCLGSYVLGTFSDLEDMIASRRITKLVAMITLTPEELQQVSSLAEKYSLKFVRFSVVESPLTQSKEA